MNYTALVQHPAGLGFELHADTLAECEEIAERFAARGYSVTIERN